MTGRNRMGLDPVAARKLVEIVAGTHRIVDRIQDGARSIDARL